MQRDKFADCANLPDILADLVQREKVQSVVLGAAWSGYSDEGMLIEREGRRLPLNTKEGMDAFFANLVHRGGNHIADGGIVVRGDGADLGDLFRILGRL